MIGKAKGGRKNRKWGRNKKWCESYRNSQRREKNKLQRLVKHMARHPNDRTGRSATDRCRNELNIRIAAE